MNPGGRLEGMLGWIVGNGVGAGFALGMLIAGVWGVLVVLGGVLNPVVLHAERLEPDFEDSNGGIRHTH
ncbi:MAG: hypothetical protein HC933_07725 [Pleurocapsa sp. SU_196_0]|nr:hypothetical protein [Pleurocapsa sp. SU_196_0]